MPTSEVKAVGCGCVTIASCIMLALSFSILSPHQYGIRYNTVRRTLYHDVYGNGRWFLGLGQEFIKFPRRFQYLEYSNAEDGGDENKPITCWSKDGQEVTLEVGMYYYHMREKLVDKYYKFTTGTEPVVEKVARHAIRDTCVKFDTIQFFEDRGTIQAALKAMVNKRLIGQTYCAVPLFNLMSIDVPSLFEAAVNTKIITKQRERTLQYKRYTEVTRAKIGVLVANAHKNITLIKAVAQYDARLAVAAAEAGVLREVLPMESKMHKVVMDALFAGNAVTKNRNLLHYVWASMLREKHDKTKFMVGFNGGTNLAVQ
jgi:regulator of protease activity HflC (stomatin/prohibitin superfamily)